MIGQNIYANTGVITMPDIAGNSLSAATRLNLTQNLQTFPDTVTATADDYYAFSVASRSSVSLSLTGLSNDANLQLLDGTGNSLSIGGVVQTSTNPGRFAESITATLNPGLYYIRVTAAPNVTRADYSLNIIGAQNLRSDIVWHLYDEDGRTRIWQLDPNNLSGPPAAVVSAPAEPNPRWWLQATGDFNQDGQTDLVWRNYGAGDGRVEIWLMNQNGAVRDQVVPLTNRLDLNWRIQAAGDFNQDGQTDLVWRNVAGNPASTNNLEIWLMNGTVRTQTVAIQSTFDPNWRVQAAGDFNKDGFTDLIWRNVSPTNGDVAIWFMNGTVPTSKVVFANRRDVNWQIQGAGDFNLDGSQDLLWRNYSQTGNERGNVEIWQLNGTFIQRIVPVPGTPNLNWRITSPYTRVLDVDPIDTAGNTLARAFNLGSNLSGSATYRGFVGTASAGTVDVADYYQFTLGSQARLNLSLTELASDLNLELLNSRGEVVQRSTLTGSTAESISRTLDAGAYYIHVFPTQGSSTYALSVGVNNFPVLATQRVLSLSEGTSASITSVLLNVTDIDSTAEQLVYTLGAVPTQGGLTANGTSLSAGSTFTQALLNGTGILYSHSGSETLSDSFTFTVSDGSSGGTIGNTTFSIAVAPVNDPPTLATNLALTVSEGGAANITGTLLQATDPDSPTERLVYTLNALPVNGRLALNGTTLSQGSTFSQTSLSTGPGLLYSHNGGETLSDSFTFTLADGAGGVLSGKTFSIAVTGVNDPPTLTVPTTVITADQGLNATIAGIQITDPDAGTQDLTLTLRAGNGVLTLSSLQGVRLIQGDGTEDAILSFSGSLAAVNAAVQSLVYRSNPGFRGADTIAVTVNDNGNTGAGGDQQVSQTISLTVIAVNQPPVITLPPLPPVVREDDSAPITGIRISDPDAAGGDMTVEISATNGLLSLSPNSGVTFLTGDGTQDRVLAFRAPLSVVNSALSSLTYRGTPEFSGSDAIVVQVSDNGNTGSGVALSDRQTLTFTVTPVNDRPVVTVPGAQTVNQQGSLTLAGISVTDVDAGSGILTANLRSAGGTLSLGATTGVTFATGSTNGSSALIFSGTLPALNAALGNLVYTGSPNFRGTDTLTIDVNDNGNTGEGIALSNDRTTIAVTVLSVNQPPVISIPTNLEANAGAALPLPGVVVTDPDAGGTRSTVTIAAQSGVLSLTAPTGVEFLVGNGNQNNRITIRGALGAVNAALATLVYRANANFQGLEAITISASDEVATGNGGTSQSDTKTIAVNVGGAINRPPVVINDSYNTRRNADLTIASPGVLRNDFDPDGFPLTAALATPTTNGSVILNANGSFTYRPNPGFTGADSFTYLASDGGSNATATVLLSVTNGSPTAANDTYSTLRNTALTISAPGILANDTDPDRDPLTVTAGTLTGSSGGTLSLNSTGAFVYTPLTNFAGVDTFTYQASDGQFSSNTATVLVTVNPGANLAPTVTTTPGGFTYTENSTATPIDAGLLITDIDSPNLAGATVAISSGFTPGQDTLSFASLGTIRGTYNSATGILTFTGPASQVDYQTLLRSVAYVNSSNNPSPATRVFTFTVNDGGTTNNLGTAARTLSVITENDAPIAANDVYSTLRNSSLTVTAPGVLVNDTDPDGTSLTVSAGSFTSPSGGTLSLNSNGAFVYTPATGFAGIDSFTYVASDGLAAATATVQISVGATNRAPIAVNDTTFSTNRNAPLTITAPGVLVNDTDPDGDPVTVVPGSFTSANGTLSLNSTGAFTYTPNSTFTGTDSFVYQASDGLLRSSATIQISVAPTTNRAPIATNDTTYTTRVNTPLSIAAPGVLVNDTDPDGDTVTAVAGALRGTSGGTLSLNANGAFTYTPTSTFQGSETFTYVASDGLLRSTATIQISVGTTANTAPTVTNDSYSTTRNTPLSITAPGVLANDRDAEQTTLTAIPGITSSQNGTLSLNGNGAFTYTPNSTFTTGIDTFTYRVSDGTLTSTQFGTVLITVGATGTNRAPIAANDTFQVTQGSLFQVEAADGVRRGDSDPDGDPLTFSVSTNPTRGTLSFSANGAFSYRPNASFTSGIDTFTYIASDGRLQSTPAVVTLSVGANTPPTANPDSYRVPPGRPSQRDEEQGVLFNDTDTPGSTLTVVSAGTRTGSNGGTLNLSANGAFTYTPRTGFIAGFDSFTYQASDGSLTSPSTSIVFTIAPNTPPTAQNDTYRVVGGTPLVVSDRINGVLRGDTDADGDELTVSVGLGNRVNPNGGTLNLSANGTFTYNPRAGATGIDTFTYAVTDGIGLSNTATITFSVGTNTAPTLSVDTYRVTPNQTLTVTAPGILANDTDAEGRDTLTAFPQTNVQRGTLSLSRDGSFTYRPNPGVVAGLDSFTYRVNDGFVNAFSTVTLSIGPNTAPIAVNDTGYTVNQGATLTVPSALSLLRNDSDPENDPLSVVVGASPIIASSNGGSVTLSTDGTFVYTPRSGFVGSDSFTYRISDGTATSNPATATISVRTNSSVLRAVNDTYATVSANSPFTVAGAGVLANDDLGAAPAPPTVVAGVRPGRLGTLSLNSDGSFTYAPNPNQVGVDTFTYQASDRVNTTTGSITFTVGAINSPPIVTAPASQTGPINSTVTLAGISVTDPDAGANTVSVGLTATTGNLTLSTTQGLAGSTGNGTRAVALTGTLAAINAALNNLRYVRTGNQVAGTDTITITANDRGNFGGTNQPQTGTASISVTIA